MNSGKLVYLLIVLWLACGGFCPAAGAVIANFDDLPLSPGSYWNGSDNSGGFSSGSAKFNNYYNSEWSYWEGFAYSNMTDTVTQGLGSQFNAITGCGQAGSANYALLYTGFMTSPTVTFDKPSNIPGLYVANNNYAYYSMLNGDAFSRAFKDGDWFKLTITGRDTQDNKTGDVEVFLADYRNAAAFILDTWLFVDLSSLGQVKSLVFSLSSSDVGPWGMNTPAYCAVDTIIPEPAGFFIISSGALFLLRRKR